MSPGSSGALEVERYIGACLITSQSRSKINASKSAQAREQFYPRGERFVPDVYPGGYVNVDNRYHHVQRCNSVDQWAGGVPLISFANYQRRVRHLEPPENLRCVSPRVQDQHNPLVRLAFHTQGAPLILASRYNHRKNRLPRNSAVTKDLPSAKITLPNCKNNQNVCGVDTVSVASDESSGSANSENCLPRIIKPRKRRKKDRKLPHLVRPVGADETFSTDSASPDIDSPPAGIITLQPYIPFAYDHSRYRPVLDNFPVVNHNRLLDKYKTVNDSFETPKLHHSFEDLEDLLGDDKDLNDNQETSSCQCRYCDPSGQIWDVDRDCYSPFLTPPDQHKTFQFPDIKVDSLIKADTLTTNYTYPISSEIISRLSSFTISDHNDNRKTNPSTPRSPTDLEVSTEIVTSLNGHRDLEIKFFSSSSPPYGIRYGKSAVEDKNDIYSSINDKNNCKNSSSVNIERSKSISEL